MGDWFWNGRHVQCALQLGVPRQHLAVDFSCLQLRQ